MYNTALEKPQHRSVIPISDNDDDDDDDDDDVDVDDDDDDDDDCCYNIVTPRDLSLISSSTRFISASVFSSSFTSYSSPSKLSSFSSQHVDLP